MEETEKNKQLYGLLGKNISYSFSRGYFTEKFKKEHLNNCEYVNFDLQNISDFPKLISKHPTQLKGMNVTIPYKLDIFQYLDEVDEIASEIGAVNTIKISKKGKLKGYNTDAYGFEKSLQPLLHQSHKKALILGTGGASKAVAFVLKKQGISFSFVSRNPQKKNEISYTQISEEILNTHTLIINCTPLGTHPNTTDCPNIPYQYLGEHHLLYDLIYNPAETTFLSKGKERGSSIKNGLEMLENQAEKAWEIWNK